MARPMTRGANVALTREIPTLTSVVLGVALTSNEAALVDNVVVATLLCDERSRVLSDRHVVFFNQLAEPDMSVQQLQRAMGTDIEQVEVDLPAVPAEVRRIVIVTYINEGLAPRRTLGQLREARVRVLDASNGAELVRSEDLAGALTSETGLALAELYRHGRDWKFRVIGQGYATGMRGIAADHGVDL